MDCQKCGKPFVSKYTLMRHMKSKHKTDNQASLVSDENDDQASVSPDEEMSTNEDDQGSDSRDDKSSMNGDLSDEDEDEKSSWDWLLEETLDELEFEKIEDLWKNENLFRTLLKKLRKNTEDMLGMAEKVSSSSLYTEITQEQERLEENGYEDGESMKVAWDNRRYLIIKLLKERQDVLREAMFDK